MTFSAMPSLKLRKYLGSRNKEGIQSQIDNSSEHKTIHRNTGHIICELTENWAS